MSIMTDPTQGWHSLAACTGTGLVLWFGPPEPDEPGGYDESDDQRRWRERRATHICESCPVREPCLEEELARPVRDQWGVRGGMTARSRRGLIDRRRREARKALRAQQTEAS